MRMTSRSTASTREHCCRSPPKPKLIPKANPIPTTSASRRSASTPTLRSRTWSILHNEQRLKAARQQEQRLSAGQPRRSGERIKIDDTAQRVTIRIDTANGLDEITGLLAQHLPEYLPLRARAEALRDRRALAWLRRPRGARPAWAEELTTILQRRERRRAKWTAIVTIVSAIVIALVAAAQDLLAQEALERSNGGSF